MKQKHREDVKCLLHTEREDMGSGTVSYINFVLKQKEYEIPFIIFVSEESMNKVGKIPGQIARFSRASQCA